MNDESAFDDLLDPPAPRGLRPGDSVHFHVAMTVPTSYMRAEVVEPGQTLVLTPEIIELSRDRHGWSWLSLTDDPEEQVRRYGRTRFSPGPAPAGYLPDPGTVEYVEMARREHQALLQIQDPDEQHTAMARYRQRFPERSRHLV